MYSKIVFWKSLGSLDMSGTQTLGISKLAEIIVISKDINFKFAAFQVVASSFLSLNYSK